MFNCTKHGWQHLINSCPNCFTWSTGNSTFEPSAISMVDKNHYDTIASQLKSMELWYARKNLEINELSNQLKKAEEVIKRLTECHLPMKPCSGADLTQKMLEENIEIAKEYLKGKK